MNITTIIKKRCTELGASAHSALLAPHIEESVRDRASKLVRECDEKVAQLRDKLEADVGNLITDRELGRAFKAQLAQAKQQKENFNPQT